MANPTLVLSDRTGVRFVEPDPVDGIGLGESDTDELAVGENAPGNDARASSWPSPQSTSWSVNALVLYAV